MANASDQSKTGFVTIATVRSRAEAQEIAAKLKSAGVASLLSAERAAPAPLAGSRSFAGTKVQVRRSDVETALRTLQRPRENGADPRSGEREATFRLTRWRLDLDSWQGAAVAVVAITALASLLALWLF